MKRQKKSAPQSPPGVSEIDMATSLNWFPINLRLRVESLRAMVKALMQALELRRMEFEHKHKVEIKRAFGTGYGFQEDEGFELFDSVLNEVLKAMLVAIYGAFEHEAHFLCECAYADDKTSRPPKSEQRLKDSGEYLRKECRIRNELFDSRDWNFLLKMYGVRNGITHAGGLFRRSSTNGKTKDAVQFIDDCRELELNEMHFIRVNEHMCEQLLGCGERSLVRLCKEAERANTLGKVVAAGETKRRRKR